MIIIRNRKNPSEIKEVPDDEFELMSEDKDELALIEEDWEIINAGPDAEQKVKREASPINRLISGAARGLTSGVVGKPQKGPAGTLGEMLGGAVQEGGLSLLAARIHPALGRVTNAVVPVASGMLQGAVEAPEGQGWEGALKGGAVGLAGQALARPISKFVEGVAGKVGRTMGLKKISLAQRASGLDFSNKMKDNNAQISALEKELAEGRVLNMDKQATLHGLIGDSRRASADLAEIDRIWKSGKTSDFSPSEEELFARYGLSVTPHAPTGGQQDFRRLAKEAADLDIRVKEIYGQQSMATGSDKVLGEMQIDRAQRQGDQLRRDLRRDQEITDREIANKYEMEGERYGNVASGATTGAVGGAGSAFAAQMADPALRDVPLRDVSPEQMGAALKRAVGIITSDEELSASEKMGLLADAQNDIDRMAKERKTAVFPSAGGLRRMSRPQPAAPGPEPARGPDTDEERRLAAASFSDAVLSRYPLETARQMARGRLQMLGQLPSLSPAQQAEARRLGVWLTKKE